MGKRLAVIVVLASAGAVWAGAETGPATRAAAGPPRYSLQVGEEITYRDRFHALNYGMPRDSVGMITFRVIGRAPGGVGWRLATGSGHNGPVVFCLWPDGHTDTFIPKAAAVIFPPLPPTDAADAQWSVPNAGHGNSIYRRQPAIQQSDAGLIVYTVEDHSFMDGPYDERDTQSGVFDPTRGLVVRARWHFQFGQGRQGGIGDDEFELVSTATTRPAEWTADYARQVDTAVAAREAYISAAEADAKLGPAAGPTTRMSDLLAARAGITDPTLAASLTALAARDAQMMARLRKEEQDKLMQVGQAAPLWTMFDLDGRVHRLADLRGRVVVLDFWYRMCPPCMEAMPQVKQLSVDYASRPVTVLGVNTDDDVADARKVVDSLGLAYPQLRASMGAGGTTRPAVPTDYHVPGYPTLFVIGPDGVIRGVHVGYSPDLGQSVGREIDALLGDPTSRPVAE